MGMFTKLALRLPDPPRLYDPERLRAWMVDIEAVIGRLRTGTGLPAKSPKTANYSITAEDEVVLVDTTGGNVTITLPAISQGMIDSQFDVTIKKQATLYSVLISPTGDTIDGHTGVAITVNNTALHLRATADGWKIT